MEPNFYITLMDSPDGISFRRHEALEILSLEALQSIVGGLIEPMFTVDSPFRPNHMITGYVNEEGWLLHLPSFIRYNGSPVAGNMVVVGLNDQTGESSLLTDEEASWFSDRVRQSFGAYNIVVS